jgi:hypothetical protein
MAPLITFNWYANVSVIKRSTFPVTDKPCVRTFMVSCKFVSIITFYWSIIAKLIDFAGKTVLFREAV